MELIRSNKGGKKLCKAGFMYTQKSASTISVYWTCTKRTSGCRGSLKTTLEMIQPVVSHGHNHLPDEVNGSVVKARAEMVRLAKENRDRPSLVYANAVSNLHEETMANLPGVDICKRTIRNQEILKSHQYHINLMNCALKGNGQKRSPILAICCLIVVNMCHLEFFSSQQTTSFESWQNLIRG